VGTDGITEEFSNALVNVVQSRFAEFGYGLALIANKVVVLAMADGFFVLGQAANELVFSHQIAFYQEVKGIVNGCSANPVVFGLHAFEEFFHVKMLVSAVNFIEDSEPFWGFAELIFFEVFREQLPDFFWGIGIAHGLGEFSVMRSTLRTPFTSLIFSSNSSRCRVCSTNKVILPSKIPSFESKLRERMLTFS
jgi:hypothetical protein